MREKLSTYFVLLLLWFRYYVYVFLKRNFSFPSLEEYTQLEYSNYVKLGVDFNELADKSFIAYPLQRKKRIEVFIKRYFLEMSEVLDYFTSCILLRLISSQYTGLENRFFFFHIFSFYRQQVQCTEYKTTVRSTPEWDKMLLFFASSTVSTGHLQWTCYMDNKVEISKINAAMCIVQNPLRNSQTQFTDSGPNDTTKTTV